MAGDINRRFVLSAVAAAIAIVGFVVIGGHAALMAEDLTWADYRANLRENPTFGCDTFPSVDPDILLIGDSHLYAGVDFNILSIAFSKSVSACALGGLYAESIPFVLKRIEQSDHYPDTIIYAASLRQLTEGRHKARQIAGHRQRLNAEPVCTPFSGKEGLLKILKDCGPGYLAKAAFKKILGKPLYRTSAGRERAAIDRHASKIDSIGGDVFSLPVLLNSPAYKDQWERRIAEIELDSHLDGVYSELEGFVRSHSVRFYVIAMPESPLLESMYPPEVREGYERMLERFKPFAERVISLDVRSWGIGNRHFVNRQLLDNYDYDRWCSTDFLPSTDDMDLDHMNPVGAVLFTRKIVERIQLPQ
jgi:hypothetical protein